MLRVQKQSEAVTRSCSKGKIFLKNLQNTQENTCAVPSNAFTCYSENFLYITTNFINYQVMATSKNSHVHVLSETIKNTLEEMKKRKLKTQLKWGKLLFYVIIHREIFTYLKNEKYLILFVDSSKFYVFLF